MGRIAGFLLLVSMPGFAWAANVDGLWVGYYAYAPEQGSGRVESAMVLEVFDTMVHGTMVERQTFGDEIFPGLPSDITGSIEGNTLSLSKVYLHEFLKEGDAAALRIYQLALSPDGNELSGFWVVGDLQGRLYFRRVTPESADRIPAPH